MRIAGSGRGQGALLVARFTLDFRLAVVVCSAPGEKRKEREREGAKQCKTDEGKCFSIYF